MIKPIIRFTKQIKAEAAIAAAATLAEMPYTLSADGMRVYDEDGGWYGMLYFRSGEEVIAIPEFYVDEENVSLAGSRGGDYTFSGDTLKAGFYAC